MADWMIKAAQEMFPKEQVIWAVSVIERHYRAAQTPTEIEDQLRRALFRLMGLTQELEKFCVSSEYFNEVMHEAKDAYNRARAAQATESTPPTEYQHHVLCSALRSERVGSSGCSCASITKSLSGATGTGKDRCPTKRFTVQEHMQGDCDCGHSPAPAPQTKQEEIHQWKEWRMKLLDAWRNDHRATMTALLEYGPYESRQEGDQQ